MPYYVKVASYTVKGRGPFSDVVVNFTEQGSMLCNIAVNCVKSSLPVIVPRSGPSPNITRLSDSSIAVSWEPLTLEEARGFVTGYTVTAVPTEARRRKRRHEEEIVTSVDPSTSRVVLNGLNPRLAYWVSVSGSTAAGTSTNNARQLAQIPPPIGKCDDLRKKIKTVAFQSQKMQVLHLHHQLSLLHKELQILSRQ